MQKLKTKVEKSKSVSSITPKAIRSGANLLPVKGLIFAMAYAVINDHVSRSRSSEVAASMQKVSKQLKELMKLANDLQGAKDVSSIALYQSMKHSIAAYVGLFYALEHSTRDAYVENANGPSKRMKKEQNLLLIPAVMASQGEDKSEVAAYLTRNMYKVPFRVLYHSSKAAMHIELFEQAMGIKTAPDHMVKRFSSVLDRMEKKMKEIDNGRINPIEDEMLKNMFVTEAIHMSNNTDMKLAEFISEKVMPNTFNSKVANRIQRR